MKKLKVLIGYPNLPMMFTPVLAVGLLTTICKNAGADVQLFESTTYTDDEVSGMLLKSKMGNGRSYDADDISLDLKPSDQFIPDWVEFVNDYQPDLILISTVEDTYDETVEMLKVIHHLNIPHIVGGVFPINAPEMCLSSEYINTICRFEGELVIEQVLDKLMADVDWQTTAGLWFNRDGHLIKNPSQPLCDINNIIPDYSLYPPHRFLRPIGGRIVKALQIETFRGCPYACTYCNSPITRSMDKNFLRRKTMDHMREELAYYIETIAPTYWFIGDDSFLARPKDEIFELCKIFKEFEIPWYCNTRIENIDEDILTAMKDSYCDRMQFGIESGNEEYRKVKLKRNVTNEVYLKKAEILNNSGIPYGLNVIIGLPSETKSMVFDTIELIRAFKGHDGIAVSQFIPYRGTWLRDYAVECGWIAPEWRSRGGFLPLDETVLDMPLPFLQPDDIHRFLHTFKHLCFFDKIYWEDINYAYDVDKLEVLDEIYNNDFYTSRGAQSGTDHIKQRISNRYACASDDAVDIKGLLI